MKSRLLELGFEYVPNIITPSEAISIKYKNLCDLLKVHGSLSGKYDPDRGNVLTIYTPPSCAFIMPRAHRILEDLCGEELIPTYWFSTTYHNGGRMVCHTDRPSCEISITMNICGDAHWPIKLKDKTGKVQSTITPVGCGVAYLGTEIPHWRSPLRTHDKDKFMQLFLHFVRKNGPYADYAFDGQKVNHDRLQYAYVSSS